MYAWIVLHVFVFFRFVDITSQTILSRLQLQMLTAADKVSTLWPIFYTIK